MVAVVATALTMAETDDNTKEAAVGVVKRAVVEAATAERWWL
jgi:hypothetical protein